MGPRRTLIVVWLKRKLRLGDGAASGALFIIYQKGISGYSAQIKTYGAYKIKNI
jgi:hypothetical protein